MVLHGVQASRPVEVAMAPVKTTQATHYEVVCASCRCNAIVCPKRATGDATARAAHAFRRAGWHEDGVAGDKARSRWYCPACARASH